MPTEKHVVPLPNGLKVYVERQVFDPAFDTAILVNGALATTASFGQTVQYLGERMNTVCFDLPYAGQSRQHNPGCFILTKDDEVAILQHLVERFAPTYLVSVSWGGVASLFALARGCPSVRRAAICSFSPFLNDAMVDYVTRARDHIAAGENLKAAQLLNDTVGRYLPRIMKLYNYRYLTRLPRDEQDQVAFHVDQILSLQPERYLSEFSNIRCELKFVNGALDEYTTPAEVRTLAAHVPRAQFATIPGAGHFLDIEGRAQRDSTRAELLGFFCDAAPAPLGMPPDMPPACLATAMPALSS
ncbi:alpha/beta fold hydrolase [Burkholderia stagnalis]|uniref:MFS transporter n=1 Tax=Burkholderia stagnalis TaxID=1503054 RepID=A0A125FCQ1_9BURK|nr:alpha/beta hydrolase [Burkholderia stagnalis]KVZ15854.1 MFS transporter [Burkholderia stagnalis]KWA51094.1 MFS transporter [Burkholderia stagnalis]KWA54215.1 MFS transporter [Burkholderia stagnalis]KWA54777.1 MFS transporter [Burkholderia stagnalis]KWD03423.1 MFS transporter [Burkholderia stagnalis]